MYLIIRKKMLAECDTAVLMVCTLGAAFDRILNEWEARDMAKAVVVDVCGSAWTEAVCDAAEAEILTRFADGSPAVFRYENPDGARFLVYPIDPSADVGNTFFRSYTRHRELTEQGRWIGEACPERIRIPADWPPTWTTRASTRPSPCSANGLKSWASSPVPTSRETNYTSLTSELAAVNFMTHSGKPV